MDRKIRELAVVWKVHELAVGVAIGVVLVALVIDIIGISKRVVDYVTWKKVVLLVGPPIRPNRLDAVFQVDSTRYWSSLAVSTFADGKVLEEKLQEGCSLALLAYDEEYVDGEDGLSFSRIYPAEGLRKDLKGVFFRLAEVRQDGEKIEVRRVGSPVKP